MDCKLRAKNCGGCPMLATEYAAQLKKKAVSYTHLTLPTTERV